MLKLSSAFLFVLLFHSKGIQALDIPPSDKAGILAEASFYASFDKGVDAQQGRGDLSLYTADSMQAFSSAKPDLNTSGVKWLEQGGKTGGALYFYEKTDKIIFYKGANNIASTVDSFSGSVSLWVRTSPAKLPEGFVDPLMITENAWNDAAFFIDFDKEKTREFRFGVFSDYTFWNPDDTPFDDIPSANRPLYPVDITFDEQKWTHIAFTWDRINQQDSAKIRFYVNGELNFERDEKLVFSWHSNKPKIILGLNYIGYIDELAIFEDALSAEEIAELALNN